MLPRQIMKKNLFFSLLVSFLVSLNLEASDKDSLNFQTQISLFGLANPTNAVLVNTGARLIPQLDYLRDFSEDRRISA